MAIANHGRHPEPARRETLRSDMANAYQMDLLNFEGIEPETAEASNAVLADFNEQFGTNVKPVLTRRRF